MDSRPVTPGGGTARSGDIRPTNPTIGRPVTTRDDTTAAFKADLDKFRQGHPQSGYDALARRLADDEKFGADNIVGRSTLHDAINPDKPLPQARTVRAMVLALTDCDNRAAAQWVSRRNQIAGESKDYSTLTRPQPAGDHSIANRGSDPTQGRLSGHSPNRSRRRFIAACTAVVVALLVSNTITYFLAHHSTSHTPLRARTGDNPANTRCVTGARVAAASGDNPAFLLELIYSPQCNAEWGRITRRDDRDMGNEVRVTIYRLSDPTGPSRQPAVEPNAHAGFTTLIVRSDPTDRLCVEGSTTTGGTTSTSARPICI